MKFRIASLLLVIAASLLVGCGAIRETTTARTATEILLVSTAAERAVKKYNIDNNIRGKKVAIDDSRYESIDKKYVVSALRNYLAANNITVVDSKNAEYVVEMRSGTLGLFNSDYGLRIPSVPIAVDFGLNIPPIKTPEFYILGRNSAQGWCKLQLWVYEAKTNSYLSSSADLWGSCYYNKWTILFLGPIDTSNDIYPDD